MTQQSITPQHNNLGTSPQPHQHNNLGTSPQPHQHNNNLGTVPKPRQPKTPKHHFETQNYNFADGELINLPVRPDSPLAKRDEDHLRDIIKQVAIDFDHDNNRFFIAYRRSINEKEEWWQSGGNSVLFYHHQLEKQFELYPINLRPDNDHGCAWPANTYVIMIKNIKRMVAQLQAKAHANIILDTPELIILEYPFEFSADDIKAFRRINSSKKEYINKLLLPKIVNPHTYRSIVDLYRATINHVNNLSAAQRQIFGYQIAQPIQEVTFSFISMSNGRIPPLRYYTEALAKINSFCDWLVTIQNFKVFTVDELYDIASLAEQVKRNINNELQQLQSKTDE